MSTRAIDFLKKHHIFHEIVTYAHHQKGAQFAAQAVGFPLPQTIKTLVVCLDNHSYALALMPGDKQLSLKKIAGLYHAKRVAMADAGVVQRLTGYLVGGVSPFGTKKQFPAAMEQRLLSYDEVMINAGRRGLMLKMAPTDIAASLKAKTADLIQT